MKNKIILSILAMFVTFLSAGASTDNIHVTMVGEFDTANPAKTIDVKVIEDGVLGRYLLRTGDIIHCNVIKVTDPKRGKRKASFVVCPTSYTSEDETTEIKENFYGKYADKVISKEELKNVDAVKVGKKAAITVGGHFVKGLSSAVSLAEGMIENEDGNRLKSGVKKVYKDSPLSYVEKGEELELGTGESFYLKFKPSKSKNSEDIQEEVFGEEE